MVAENKVTVIEKDGHRVTVDENGAIPQVEVELGAGMTDEDYVAWNIAGAIKTIRRSPGENELTLMVYRMHRSVLERRGVSPELLAEGDRALEKYTGLVVELE